MGRTSLFPVFDILITHLLLVIVRYFDIVGITIIKPETDTPLIVDVDRILSLSVPSELMKPIAGRNLEIFYSRRQIHVLKLSSRPPNYFRWKPF
jgi:hypothetical protein